MHPSVVIEFMDKQGNVKSHPPGAPVVKIVIGQVKASDPSYPSGQNQETVYALIDTGADDVYIDEALAARLQLHRTTSREVQGATSTIQSWAHAGFFRFSGTQKNYAADFVATPLAGNGRRYQVVFGMQLLDKGVLEMDFHRHTYRFSLEDCLP
ncbi:MAG: retropepsin-like aspartic protease [Pseudomonas kermanshahensis]|uniref:retropepsin-like aspartic protease n=1 Tax=Pseudomonas kermanshahensis TaxID=2745482 RepID=UPI003D151428